jgi:hypothetical protein
MAGFLGVSSETPVDEPEELMIHAQGCLRSWNENSKQPMQASVALDISPTENVCCD